MGFEKIVDIIAVIASWFSPELKEKRYRVKLAEFKAEKAKLMAISPCTPAIAKRLEQIEIQILKIENYLQC